MSTPQIDCRFFNGYKPCGRHATCESGCPAYQKRGAQVLLIHLGALGAVVRSTALLAPIRRRNPGAQITWITEAPAHRLFQGHPQVDRVLTTSESDLLELSVLEFDVAYIVDKSAKAWGIFKRTRAQQVFGFQALSTGAIAPITPAAQELWSLGLDDHKKFFENQKSEIQLITEALELNYQRDEYNLPLNEAERQLQAQRWGEWSEMGRKVVIGLNTGCAATLPAKKLSVENHRELIRKLEKDSSLSLVLLGGPEDTERNRQIGEQNSAWQSPTTAGLRDGLVSVAACDLVISGDSLGLHMAISQRKPVIAWFGPTCAHEIELYGRGQKILTQAPCSPCWKRSCHKPVMCYDLVELDDIVDAVQTQIRALRKGAPSSSAEPGGPDRLLG